MTIQEALSYASQFVLSYVIWIVIIWGGMGLVYIVASLLGIDLTK